MQSSFANPEQKKFYTIMRAFKIGNILGSIVALLLIVKYMIGF